MSKTRFECRQIILNNWTQMTPGSETLTYLFNIFNLFLFSTILLM